MVKKKKNEIAPVVFYFNPVIGFKNDARVLFRGKDIYGNPASCLDKRMAVGGMLTLGKSHWVSWIPKAYSGARATYQNW